MDEYLILDLCYEVYSFLTVFEYTDVVPTNLLDYDKFYKVSIEPIPDIKDIAREEKNDYVYLLKYAISKLDLLELIENNKYEIIDIAINNNNNNWNIVEYLYSIGFRSYTIPSFKQLLVCNRLDLAHIDHVNDHKYGKISNEDCMYGLALDEPRQLIYEHYNEIINRITNHEEVLNFIKLELH